MEQGGGVMQNSTGNVATLETTGEAFPVVNTL